MLLSIVFIATLPAPTAQAEDLTWTQRAGKILREYRTQYPGVSELWDFEDGNKYRSEQDQIPARANEATKETFRQARNAAHRAKANIDNAKVELEELRNPSLISALGAEESALFMSKKNRIDEEQVKYEEFAQEAMTQQELGVQQALAARDEQRERFKTSLRDEIALLATDTVGALNFVLSPRHVLEAEMTVVYPEQSVARLVKDLKALQLLMIGTPQREAAYNTHTRKLDSFVMTLPTDVQVRKPGQ